MGNVGDLSQPNVYIVTGCSAGVLAFNLEIPKYYQPNMSVMESSIQSHDSELDGLLSSDLTF